jgi:hypothetical protein
MLFAQADCPVCMEDQAGPPTVALGCGHVCCKDDFIKLGGRVGQDAVDPFQPPTPAANDHASPWHITTTRPGSEDWVHNLNGDLGT